MILSKFSGKFVKPVKFLFLFDLIEGKRNEYTLYISFPANWLQKNVLFFSVSIECETDRRGSFQCHSGHPHHWPIRPEQNISYKYRRVLSI